MAFNTTLKYYGTGSIENQYIVKINYNHQISDEELYKLDETEFLNKLTEIKTISALYKKTKFSAAYFKEKEITNINYLEQNTYYIINLIITCPFEWF
jgi:hypothetical protein